MERVSGPPDESHRYEMDVRLEAVEAVAYGREVTGLFLVPLDGAGKPVIPGIYVTKSLRDPQDAPNVPPGSDYEPVGDKMRLVYNNLKSVDFTGLIPGIM